MLKINRFRNSLRKLNTNSEFQWLPPAGLDTGITVYNCVARKKVPLVLSNNNYLSWYTCGPTVYDSAHIGHASCYVKFDIIQRILRNHFKYNVVTTMNITDIDDKIIMRSQQEQVPYLEISKRYETEFWQDMHNLNVLEPNIKLRVSENMPRIISFIEQIKAKGLAYEAADKSLYFNVNKYSNYGKLQPLNKAEAEKYAKNANQAVKLHASDFALWKATKQPQEPSFESPWGAGRPGWHIECSALASMVYGQHIDIHAGGLDLRFPHHENEEAQSCVHHDCLQWVNYWLHAGSLGLAAHQSKMSKSLKNTISIADMLQNYTADEFRMACLLSNYKSNMEYSEQLMQLAAHTLSKFVAFKSDCEAYLLGLKCNTKPFDHNALLQKLTQAEAQYESCLRDDFDTAKAVSVLFELTSHTSRCINEQAKTMQPITANCAMDVVGAVLNFLVKALETFGFQFVEKRQRNVDLNAENLITDLLELRVKIREKAMSSKNKDMFQICDQIRHLMQTAGIDVKDHNKGSTWSLKENKQMNKI